MSDVTESPDDSTRQTVVTGFFLLAVFVPMGLTLEALHALKVPVYFGSSMRRELWTLAHAHGGILGILCLVYGSVAERWLSAAAGESIAKWVRWGAVLMPLGFLLGGIGTHEGDPSLGILLVPVGGVVLIVALVRAGLDCRPSRST
jgi:hypothetical protein